MGWLFQSAISSGIENIKWAMKTAEMGTIEKAVEDFQKKYSGMGTSRHEYIQKLFKTIEDSCIPHFSK